MLTLPSAGEEENEDPREARVRQIEAQFAAARAPPVHCKDPSLRPLEILPGACPITQCVVCSNMLCWLTMAAHAASGKHEAAYRQLNSL